MNVLTVCNCYWEKPSNEMGSVLDIDACLIVGTQGNSKSVLRVTG